MSSRWSFLPGLAGALLASAAWAQQSSPDWVLPNFAQRLEMNVSSPSRSGVQGLAVVRVQEAARVAPGFPGSMLIAVVLNPSGASFPFTISPSQVDDLDGDGISDEVVFTVDLKPGETRRAHLYYSTTLRDTIPYTKEVDARHNFGYNHQTVALESKQIGYRTYGGLFLDVQARAKGQPGLNNNLVGYFGSAHATTAGLDVLHVGDTLGLGGIFLRRGNELYRPPFNVPDYAHKPSPADAPQYRVIANGPLRAIVEANLEQWKIGDAVVRARARYSIEAAKEDADCDVEIVPLRLPAQAEYEVGAGVLHLPDMSKDSSTGRIALAGVQEKRIGRLGLALFYDPQQADSSQPLRTGEGLSEVAVFRQRLRPGQAVRLRYRVAAAWSGSGIEDVLGHLRAVEQSARQRIEISGYQWRQTPQAERIEGEAY